MSGHSRPTLWGREPALIIGALQAVIALAVGFGAPLSQEQTALILAASAAILAVITRQQVTPNASVAARVDDDPPPAVVAGPASEVPTGDPVTVEPIVSSEGVTYDGHGAPIYDAKHDRQP